MTTSPFFEKEKILENEVGFVVYDGFPVSEGHCLIVPHRVYPNQFDSTLCSWKGGMIISPKSSTNHRPVRFDCSGVG